MKVEMILHIDDEASEVDEIREALTEKGFKVDPFAWPRAAEDPDKEGSYTVLPDFGKYDLILLDIIMGPGDLSRRQTEGGFLTGLFFYEKYIAPVHGQKPVIFISALVDGTLQTKARKFAKEHGIVYIGKSGETVSDLLAEIQKIKAI